MDWGFISCNEGAVVIKRELSQKAKLSIYWSIFVITLWSQDLGSDQKNKVMDTNC